MISFGLSPIQFGCGTHENTGPVKIKSEDIIQALGTSTSRSKKMITGDSIQENYRLGQNGLKVWDINVQPYQARRIQFWIKPLDSEKTLSDEKLTEIQRELQEILEQQGFVEPFKAFTKRSDIIGAQTTNGKIPSSSNTHLVISSPESRKKLPTPISSATVNGKLNGYATQKGPKDEAALRALTDLKARYQVVSRVNEFGRAYPEAVFFVDLPPQDESKPGLELWPTETLQQLADTLQRKLNPYRVIAEVAEVPLDPKLREQTQEQMDWEIPPGSNVCSWGTCGTSKCGNKSIVLPESLYQKWSSLGRAIPQTTGTILLETA